MPGPNKPSIGKVHLTNFRKHEDLEVSFGEGLNVLHGDNNAGKTTLLRAIRFASMQDTASRERTIRVGASEASVELAVGDATVARTFGKKSNHIEAAGLSFDNPTPDVISGALAKALLPLGLGSLEIPGGDSVWPCYLGPGELFLVRSTPVQVKRILSALSYADLFERARDIAKGLRDRDNQAARQARSECEQAKKDMEALRPKLEALLPLKAKLEDIGPKQEAIEAKLSKLADIKAQLASLAAKMPSSKAIAHAEALRDRMLELKAEYDEMVRRGKELTNLKREVDANREALRNATGRERDTQRELQELKAEAFAAGVCPLCGSDVSAGANA